MIPILYDKNETDFNNIGIGFLVDTILCEVTEERNGIYELVLQYPITGKWYSHITDGAIIKAKANETSELQLFRIYKTGKPLKGIVTYNAEHISYDLNGIPILSFNIKNATAQMAMNKAFEETALEHSFTAISDISTLNSTSILLPCSARAILGGQQGSILDVWGGEYEFDNFIVKLHSHRGANKGVIIEYGKNLIDINQESNIAECYTHIFPYAKKTVQTTDENGNIIENHEEIITLSEKILPLFSAENIGRLKAFIIDLTENFQQDESITEETLRIKTNEYILKNNLGTPKVNITVSFVQLWRTEDYKNIAPLERVSLCDIVTVRFVALGIVTTAKVIKTVYDSLGEKYKTVELGDYKNNFAASQAQQNKDIKNLTKTINSGFAKATADIAKAVKNATNLITGQSGGYIVLNPAEMPQEILIMDSPNISEAMKVWRWNSSGLGYSSTGYNGEYDLAITMNGQIVADFISAGILNGALLQADSVKSEAISQYFKTEISNEIGEAAKTVEQSFIAADEHLMSVITNINNVLSGNISTVEESISKLQQTVDNFLLSYINKSTGGINYILNSSGLNGVSDDWEYSGVVTTLQNEEAINNTISGSLFSLRSATLSQKINVIAGMTYTITFRTKRTSESRGYVKIYNGVEDLYIYDKQEIENWTEYSLTFTAPGNTITFTTGTTGSYLYIADIMLVEGDVKSRWTPAPNEIYTANVKIDRRGINITNSESSTETIIDNTQFAVKHKGETVLTVNKDLSTLKKTEITDELTVGKAKFIPKTNGLDFVLLD